MTDYPLKAERPDLDFPALFEQCVELVYRYHLARTGDVEAAEDLTAETYRAALEERGGYLSEDGPPAAWLAAIARRTLADYLRRGYRGRAQPVRPAPWNASSGPALAEAMRLLEMARVAQILRAMPTIQAEAVALHFFAGLELPDLAAALERSEETIKKLAQRGLAALHERLLSAREVKR